MIQNQSLKDAEQNLVKASDPSDIVKTDGAPAGPNQQLVFNPESDPDCMQNHIVIWRNYININC